MINRSYKLRKIDLKEFKRIYKNNLKNDFPFSERKPFFLIKKCIKKINTLVIF